ncbi:zinc finger, C2H2-like protein [Tanacetum coccineum]|uniref:Zinc finger, C2H2-like protein n=1 Tax=Tanacetum coccineum TaxID=301880 RepID=A0ABQ4XAT2_9ASTR
MTPMASAVMHPTGNFGVVTPPMTITQPLQCEVCDITCHTADVLATHKLGKKHSKNLQKQAITSVIAQNMPPLTPASAPSVGKLEEKMHRILQNGASVDTLLHCDLCNVTCNNENAYQSHVASKKHVAKAIMQQAGTSGGGGLLTPTSEGDCKPQPLSSNVFQCELCNISCTSNELLNFHISGKKHQKKLKDSVQVPDPIEGPTIFSHEVKHASCEICGITCDTYEVLKTHLSGRKHLKNLEKSQKPSVPHNPVPTSDASLTVVERAATPTVVEPVSTPKVVEPVSTPKVVEPVSTPKVVEPVAAPTLVEPVAAPTLVEPVSTTTVVEVLQESLKKDDKIVISHEAKPTCEICKISCDTDEMLKIHSTGRKHKKNLKKLEKTSVLHKHVPTTHDGGEIATSMAADQLQGSLKDDKNVNGDGSIRKGKRSGSQMDLETKKQKIMQVGTAPASLRACTVCSVVCNSPKVFDFHMAGQKHAAMVAKQAKAQ